MKSQLGKKTIAIYLLPNISRTKVNQIMKIGWSIEYNMRNIFLEKSYGKCGGETIPRPFFQNSAIMIFNSLKFYTVCFHCMPSRGLLRAI